MAPLVPVPYLYGGNIRVSSTTTSTNYNLYEPLTTASYTNYPPFGYQEPEPTRQPETKADRQRRMMALHLKRLEIGSYAQARPSLPTYQPPDPRRVYLLRTFRRCSRRDQSRKKKAPVV